MMASQTKQTVSQPVVQVGPTSGKVPGSALILLEMEYLERSIHRMMCGWGNQFLEWEDKQALSRHVWDQAEVVRRLRHRMDQFPGVRAGAPVSKRLEALANTVLLAPCFEDAVDGIYQVLSTALAQAYHHFLQSVHPIHDAPTHEIIQEIVTTRELHRAWLRDYRRRNPHQTDRDYVQNIVKQLGEIDNLKTPVSKDGEAADPVGVNTMFRPLTPRIKKEWIGDPTQDVMPYIKVDFAQSLETRRLFWPIGYMRELGLAIEQLQWLYDSPYMPWEFHYDESRHLWDEARHGDSGYSRLQDFGIRIEDVGFVMHVPGEPKPYPSPCEPLPAMTPKQLYEAVFFIGMVAETGHFEVKRQAYADFRDGGDFASAEMMLYDIIDETAHVQYVKKWLSLLAEHASVNNTHFEKRGAVLRSQAKTKMAQIIAESKTLSCETGDPLYDRYKHYLQIMRKQCPLSNVASCPLRSPLPM